MGYYAMRPKLAKWARKPQWGQALHLTATTTGAAETVTITRMTLNVPGAIYWGDGTVTRVNANDTTAKSHIYAVAGTYKITVPQAIHITQIKLDNAKLGGLNTAELRYSPIIYFWLVLATGCTINSADMAAWISTAWYLASMPAGGTYTINSAHMAAWMPLTWVLASMPAGGTYTINSANMAAWISTYWRLHSMPAGTYTINNAHMAAWPLTFWSLFFMPAGGSSYTFAASCMRNWTGIQTIQCQDLGLLVAAVDTVVHDVWSGKATYTEAAPTLNIGGSNANPSGVYQNICPPTTGLEEVFDLVNGNCTPAGPEWAVTY